MCSTPGIFTRHSKSFPNNTYEIGIFIISTAQMKILRHRNVSKLPKITQISGFTIRIYMTDSANCICNLETLTLNKCTLCGGDPVNSFVWFLFEVLTFIFTAMSFSAHLPACIFFSCLPPSGRRRGLSWSLERG